MEIRRASIEDAGGIAAVHVRAWQEAYRGLFPDEFLASLSIEEREARWREILQSPGADTWVAVPAHSVLGWMSIGPSRDADAGVATGELWALYVDPDAWRSGVGRALWHEAEARLRRAGYHACTLWVLKENHRARRFYEAVGFSLDPGQEMPFERGGVTLPMVRMHRNLGGEPT